MFCCFKLAAPLLTVYVFRSAVTARIGVASPNHTGLSQLYMILIAGFSRRLLEPYNSYPTSEAIYCSLPEWVDLTARIKCKSLFQIRCFLFKNNRTKKLYLVEQYKRILKRFIEVRRNTTYLVVTWHNSTPFPILCCKRN